MNWHKTPKSDEFYELSYTLFNVAVGVGSNQALYDASF